MDTNWIESEEIVCEIGMLIIIQICNEIIIKEAPQIQDIPITARLRLIWDSLQGRTQIIIKIA